MATTIEESRMLLELGIDPKTADMSWTNASFKGVNYVDPWRLNPLAPDVVEKTLSAPSDLFEWTKGWEVVPAWSLGTLITIISGIDPKRFSFIFYSDIDNWVGYFVEYGYGRKITRTDSDLISLCVNMVKRLAEEGYIKTKEE